MCGMARASKPPSTLPPSLAEAIREARLANGWSQSKLARLLDTPESSVQKWESGRNLPSHPHYARMCLLFGWPLPYSGESSTARKITLTDWPSTTSPDALAPAMAGG
jgi:ribosome-binding protein aMBF1 (putative translation factor)